jgi:epoxyqueuosine reductase
MTSGLRAWADQRRYAVAWGPASLVSLARQELRQREQDGEIEPAFAHDALSFAFEGDVPPNWHVLAVAVPRPAHHVRFIVGNTPVDAVMPPTYYRYRPMMEDVRQDLSEHVFTGYRLTTLSAPLKTLASLLGLVRYGRNNIVYAPEMGSYLQLFGYATDAPLPVDADWVPCEPSLLDECTGCGICTARCPTGAIDPTRVLLRAERCLTRANEATGPWPPDVSPDTHHCLVGCLLCQRHCPANPDLPVADTGVVFTESETQALIDGGDGSGAVWDGIRAHLTQLGQPDLQPVLGRNLRAILASR